MMSPAEIIRNVKLLDNDQIEKLATLLLIIRTPRFHGSKTIHYTDGIPRKLVDNVTREL